MLAETLTHQGHKVQLTREPGGDPVSEEIRKILLDGDDHSISDRAELLLYLAARAQHTEHIILPKLREDFIVICARYTDSTIAYQGYGNGFDLGSIERMNDFATSQLVPDLTFLLDIDIETGLKRQEDWNRMERKAIDFHKRVGLGFLKQAELHPERIVVIDASQSIEAIRGQILRYISDRLGIAT